MTTTVTIREAISYGRFSSKPQEKGDSRNRQEAAYNSVISRYANRGLVASTRYGFGKLFDSGFSGFHAQHLADGGDLAKFLSLVRTGDIKSGAVLVIDEWSRFSRIAPDLAVNLLSEIVRAGVSVAVNSPDMFIETADLSSPQFVIISMMLQLAHQESLTKSRHQKSSWERRRKDGVKTAACPRWISLVGGEYVLNERATILRQAIELAINGCGAGIVRKKLGLTGKEWQGLTTIFRSRTLIGMYQPMRRVTRNRKEKNGEPIKLYPNVVDETSFYRLQAALDSRKTNKGRRGQYVTSLFTDLIHDSSNGEPMTIRRSSRNDVYLLNRTGRGKRVHYHLVETALLQYLKEITPLDIFPDDNDITRQVHHLEGEIGHINSTAAELMSEMTGKGGFVAKALAQLQTEKEAKEAELEALRRTRTTTSTERLAATQTLLSLVRQATGDELDTIRTRLKSLIRGLVESVTCNVETSTRFTLSVRLHGGQFRFVTMRQDVSRCYSAGKAA